MHHPSFPPGLRLQERGEPPYRVIGDWRAGQAAVTYNFLHSGKLVPWWLASFWENLPAQRRQLFYLPRDTGLSPVMEALLAQRAGPMFYVDIARAWVDLNRRETDLGPGDVDGGWPFGEPRPWEHGAQKGQGLLSRRCDATGEPLYDAPIALADATRRLEEVYRPGWAAQDELLARGVALFGEVVLASLHSYNTWSTPYMGGPAGILRAEVCVSDLHGRSCGAWVTAAYAESFAEQGFQVGINDPVSGAWALERVARPSEEAQAAPIRLPGVHALQIEHRKDLLGDIGATRRIVQALLRAEQRVAARKNGGAP